MQDLVQSLSPLLAYQNDAALRQLSQINTQQQTRFKHKTQAKKVKNAPTTPAV